MGTWSLAMRSRWLTCVATSTVHVYLDFLGPPYLEENVCQLYLDLGLCAPLVLYGTP